MRRRVLVLAALALIGCTRKPSSTTTKPKALLAPETEPIGTVNGQPLDLRRFNLLYQARLPPLRATESAPQLAVALKRAIAAELIDEAIISQAAQRRGVTVDAARVDAAMRDFAASFKDPASYRKYVSKYPEQAVGLRRLVQQRLLVEMMANVRADEPVSDADARSYYEQNRWQYHAPAYDSVLDISLPLSDEGREKAAQIVQLARDPRNSFSWLAMRYSNGPTAKVGGDLGRVTSATVDPRIWKALTTLAPGRTSPPIVTEQAIHVVRLVQRVPAANVSFVSARPAIERAVRARWRSARVVALVTSLRSSAKVDNALLRRYPAPPQNGSAKPMPPPSGAGAIVAPPAVRGATAAAPGTNP